MNKKLFESVKSKCKDTGLSEKYLTALTEKMGGDIQDDSTDEEAIEKAANLILDIAKEAQSEATRWASKKKKKEEEETEESKNPKKKEEEETEESEESEKKESNDSKRLKELEEKFAKLEANETKGKRNKAIAAAMEKHNIPKSFRDRLSQSISDDEDIEEAVTAMKQDFITNGLMGEDKSPKAASEKQIDEAADSLLESITAKD